MEEEQERLDNMSDEEMEDVDDMSVEEEEDYGFEYSGSEEENEEDTLAVKIENKYYTAKGLLEENNQKAMKLFLEVVTLEQEKGKWGFKALKRLVKLCFRLKDYEKMMQHYRQMLSYVKSSVTQNVSEKTITSILETVNHAHEMALLQEFYEATLETLKDAVNERLWFRTNLKLAELWFEMGEYPKMAKIIKDLHRSCQNGPGNANLSKKGTQLLQIYALEIQLYTATKNNKKLKALYEKSLQVKSGVPHPRITAIIRECGGKAHLLEREWNKAATDFFEAFKNYDEAGSDRCIQCLKYLVLASMLDEGAAGINPFDSTEAKAHAKHPELVAFTDLVAAYHSGQIRQFEDILRKNWTSIMNDPFIRTYIEDLLRNLRTQVLLDLVRPYTRISIPYISEKLNIPEKDVEDLLVYLILDNKLSGHIDQVYHILILQEGQDFRSKKYTSISKWVTGLPPVYQAIMNKA